MTESLTETISHCIKTSRLWFVSASIFNTIGKNYIMIYIYNFQATQIIDLVASENDKGISLSHSETGFWEGSVQLYSAAVYRSVHICLACIRNDEK